jgi:hypothetical protein
MKHDRVDILRIVLPALVAIGLFAFSSFIYTFPTSKDACSMKKRAHPGFAYLKQKQASPHGA